jgi:hypothetical protein
VASIVSDAVKSVYQTYVQSLKESGTFTDEAKKCAKEQALNLIEARLTPEMSEYIQSTYGDVGKYLSEAIEATLYDFKTSKGYQVKSESGKPLSKNNLTKSQAQKRLRQVEYFKKK